MKEYMSNEEFVQCKTTGNEEYNYISEELDCKGIKDIYRRIQYVKENYSGQEYLFFVLRELDDKIIFNFHNVPEKYEFTISQVDGLLRSYLFATEYLQAKLPEHMYDYIKSKSETFFSSLEKQLRKSK